MYVKRHSLLDLIKQGFIFSPDGFFQLLDLFLVVLIGLFHFISQPSHLQIHITIILSPLHKELYSPSMFYFTNIKTHYPHPFSNHPAEFLQKLLSKFVNLHLNNIHAGLGQFATLKGRLVQGWYMF